MLFSDVDLIVKMEASEAMEDELNRKTDHGGESMADTARYPYTRLPLQIGVVRLCFKKFPILKRYLVVQQLMESVYCDKIRI
jgi:hypothetical protein